MNFRLKTSIKIAAAVLASVAAFCLMTPMECHQTSVNAKAYGPDVLVITEMPTTTLATTTTVITGTTSTIIDTTTQTTSLSTTSTLIVETTTIENETEAVVELAETTMAATESAESIEIEQVESIKEYVVFKPSTHYIHRSTCHWVNDECYEIEDTNNIECRRCNECKPNLDIITYYNDPTPVVASDTGLSDYDKRLLAEITCHEYGSDWVSTAEKAKIVAGVMNRVNSSIWPNTVYDVLMQDGQFHGSWDGGYGYWPGCIEPNADSWAAVDYYFAHTSEFGSWTSWWGDGVYNHFY